MSSILLVYYWYSIRLPRFSQNIYSMYQLPCRPRFVRTINAFTRKPAANTIPPQCLCSVFILIILILRYYDYLCSKNCINYCESRVPSILLRISIRFVYIAAHFLPRSPNSTHLILLLTSIDAVRCSGILDGSVKVPTPTSLLLNPTPTSQVFN